MLYCKMIVGEIDVVDCEKIVKTFETAASCKFERGFMIKCVPGQKYIMTNLTCDPLKNIHDLTALTNC